MIVVRYAVCSERDHKPVTRVVCESKAESERELARIQKDDGGDPTINYWIAELGPECDAWRWLGVQEAGSRGEGTDG